MDFREEDPERLEGRLAELLRQRAEFNLSEPPAVFDSLSHLAAFRRLIGNIQAELSSISSTLQADSMRDSLGGLFDFGGMKHLPEPEESPLDPRQKSSWYQILDVFAAECGFDLRDRDAVHRIRQMAARHGKPLPSKHETIRNRITGR